MRSSRRFVEIKSTGHDTVSKNPGKRKIKAHFAEADRKKSVNVFPQRLVFERKNGDEPLFSKDQVLAEVVC